MGGRRVHLSIKSNGEVACGTTRSVKQTRNFAAVTCGGCQRTVHMADAEVRRRQRPHPTSGRSP